MILDEIINNGKITNHVQLYTLARVFEFFRADRGTGYKPHGTHNSISLEMEDPVDFESRATSSAMIDALGAMSDEQHVEMAQDLKHAIAVGELAAYCRPCGDDSKTPSWLRFVTSKQD
jgi:hypothetical protein